MVAVERGPLCADQVRSETGFVPILETWKARWWGGGSYVYRENWPRHGAGQEYEMHDWFLETDLGKFPFLAAEQSPHIIPLLRALSANPTPTPPRPCQKDIRPKNLLLRVFSKSS